MANPQLENGFTRIANEVMDALTKTKIGSGERQVLDGIIRKTYGFNKKEDYISISQLEKMTGLSKRWVIYTLQNLEAKNIITIKRSFKPNGYKEVNKISFQKDYTKWIVQEKSKQYRKSLNQRKLLYKNSKKGVVQEINDGKMGVVQENSGGKSVKDSAGNSQNIVQEIENNSRFPAHTKDTLTKDNTKDRDFVIQNPRISDFNNIDSVDLKYRDFFINNSNITPYTDPGIIQHGNIKSAGEIINRLNIPNPNLVNKKELTELWIKEVNNVQVAIWKDTGLSRTQTLQLAIKIGDMECPQFETLVVIIRASKQADRPYNYIKAIISNPESLEYYRNQALKTASMLPGMLKRLKKENNINQDTTSS